MVKIIQNKNQILYQCEECGLKYKSKEIAGKCQAWCSEHKSCNLDLIKYAVEDKDIAAPKERANTPTILVVFGATGDLAVKKVIPSLWNLFRHKRLPDRLSVIGFSRRNLTNIGFREFVQKTVLMSGNNKTTRRKLERFAKFFKYQTGLFNDTAAFRSLADAITEIEASWGVCANKLFYLVVPPPDYGFIFKNLASVKLNLPCGGSGGWSRILIEKPFGTDLKSARKLQALLSSYFKEEQIYRIDHYLFKEIVQGVENFRFSNNLFERAWDNTTIERIDVRLHESIGVEDRGGFYDAVGALRDVGQNHMLSMLAAITMDNNLEPGAAFVRENRAEILRTLVPWTASTVKTDTFRGQYRGYEKISGVKPGSKTETYFALKTGLLHPHWKGIPIFMEAGKRLAEPRKEIVLTLKHPPACLLCEAGSHGPNKIVFRIEPNDEITIHFWTKKPGFERMLEERVFSFFLYEKEIKTQYVEEYAKIIHEAIMGEQAVFITSEEVEALWKFTDPVVKGWRRNIAPLTRYEPGTTPTPKMLKISPDISDENKYEKNTFRANGVAIIGLGKMGANIARRLISKKWKVVGFNKTIDATKKLEEQGMGGAYSVKELAEKLTKPRIVWLMVPAGNPVDDAIFGREGLIHFLENGDIIIDGGNSFYKDSAARYKKLKKRGIHFVDIGVSGGPEGALHGASLMIGGDSKMFRKLEPLFNELSVPDGYKFFRGAGAGHFVKMIHNGIEYGMMQAIAEGFTILKKAKYKLNLSQVADVYNHGSVIESRLIDWLKNAFDANRNDLKNISGSVGYTGEGAWTVKTAKELKVRARIIEEALRFRIKSKRDPTYTGKILSALREQFGGHRVKNNKKL
ncbi:MAG: glucose-6-phosphate dehydrogenase [Candidatus Liptonbacteria bacterium]|nr:glucose-6-phosphate dehydrogenase [Candidatus Liptonbacteria bacterium]